MLERTCFSHGFAINFIRRYIIEVSKSAQFNLCYDIYNSNLYILNLYIACAFLWNNSHNCQSFRFFLLLFLNSNLCLLKSQNFTILKKEQCLQLISSILEQHYSVMYWPANLLIPNTNLLALLPTVILLFDFTAKTYLTICQ